MDPAPDSTVQLQALLDRFRQGDAQARRLLLERACQRLRRLTARVMHNSFPAVAARHDLDSIVHETWLRLAQALDTAEPPTVADFFRLAAHKIRQVLLDIVDRQRRQVARQAPAADDSTAPTAQERADLTYDPARLAMWSEFHKRVDDLTAEERQVFDMHYYLDLPQVEIAKILGVHPRKVSYLWVAATEKLAEGFAPGDSWL
jgi:RNA polymerase sigma factor (sigma-70 family)